MELADENSSMETLWLRIRGWELLLTPAFRPVSLRDDRHQPFQRLRLAGMSLHSYSRCWLHLIWGTLNREKILPKEAAARVSRYLTEYTDGKGVYMKINYVNADHVHALIDLPTGLSIEELMQLLKGSSSHWINANSVVLPGKFAWGRGYGAFSVSESNVGQVAAYIAGQEEHHHVRGFVEELGEFIDRHGLRWHDDESR
ncbi:MAG TPA: IS200/IS605 family transposase [Chthoniobacterales bacterium]|nr:IS200/IS605 family transposase [Chthoniobacterales bacterium]